MMLRPSIILIGVTVCAVAFALTLVQHSQLTSLHEQERKLAARTPEIPQPALHRVPDEATVIKVEQHAPSIELLRLRGQIGQLERRKRELASIRAENEQLHLQFANKGTNEPGAISLPAGSIRTSEARYLGYKTPEDTLETLLWAVRTHNSAHLLQAYTPETIKKQEFTLKSLVLTLDKMTEPPPMFPETGILGVRIISHFQPIDDLIFLETEAVPDPYANLGSIRFRKVEGEWKIDHS